MSPSAKVSTPNPVLFDQVLPHSHWPASFRQALHGLFFFSHSPLEPCFRDSSHELFWTCLAGAQNSRKSSPSQAVSCCHHKVFTHQEPPTSFQTYWSSDQNKCHVWAGMGPGLSASDDLPWKEALGLSLHWQVCEHQLCGSRKTGSWGAGERLQGQGELWSVRMGSAGLRTGGGSRTLQEVLLALHPASAPSHLPGRQGQLQAPSQEGFSAVGRANAELSGGA